MSTDEHVTGADPEANTPTPTPPPRVSPRPMWVLGAFNIVSVILGAAAAPFVVGQLAELTNLRTALWLVTPPVYVGAYVLFKARDHLDADAAKIFEAVLAAIQAEQAEAADAEAEVNEAGKTGAGDNEAREN